MYWFKIFAPGCNLEFVIVVLQNDSIRCNSLFRSIKIELIEKILPMHHSIFFVIDLNELSKTTRIVVVYRLGIAKSLQGKGQIFMQDIE